MLTTRTITILYIFITNHRFASRYIRATIFFQRYIVSSIILKKILIEINCIQFIYSFCSVIDLSGFGQIVSKLQIETALHSHKGTNMTKKPCI